MTKPILEVKDLDVFFGTGDAQVAAVRELVSQLILEKR